MFVDCSLIELKMFYGGLAITHLLYFGGIWLSGSASVSQGYSLTDALAPQGTDVSTIPPTFSAPSPTCRQAGSGLIVIWWEAVSFLLRCHGDYPCPFRGPGALGRVVFPQALSSWTRRPPARPP